MVAVEQITPPMVKEDQGKSALTELFNEVRNSNTEVIVERIVSDIDEIVRVVRFEGWQDTHAGEREIKQLFVQRYSSIAFIKIKICLVRRFLIFVSTTRGFKVIRLYCRVAMLCDSSSMKSMKLLETKESIITELLVC